MVVVFSSGKSDDDTKSDYDTKKVLKNKGIQVTRSTFEGLVRKMVNKPEYKFGVSFD